MNAYTHTYSLAVSKRYLWQLYDISTTKINHLCKKNVRFHTFHSKRDMFDMNYISMI